MPYNEFLLPISPTLPPITALLACRARQRKPHKPPQTCQAYSHLRSFALAIPWVLYVQYQGCHMACFLSLVNLCSNVASSERSSLAMLSKMETRASLVAHWLRICLPTQGTQVRALVQEDPTRRGATKPVRHNYWAWALEPASHNYWAHEPQLLMPACLEPVLCNKRSHCNEKPAHRNEE